MTLIESVIHKLISMKVLHTTTPYPQTQQHFMRTLTSLEEMA